MKVVDLKIKLEKLPEDMEVVVCNLADDGDGDGKINLYEVVDADVEDATNTRTGEQHDVFMIMYHNKLE